MANASADPTIFHLHIANPAKTDVKIVMTWYGDHSIIIVPDV